MRGASSDADKQRITLQYQQEFTDKQNEVVGPLFNRAQITIANVAATKKLSMVVDKRIVDVRWRRYHERRDLCNAQLERDHATAGEPAAFADRLRR